MSTSLDQSERLVGVVHVNENHFITCFLEEKILYSVSRKVVIDHFSQDESL